MTRVSRFLHRDRAERQLDAELRFDYDQRVAAKIRDGMSEPEACRAARLELGGLEQIKEGCRDARGTRWIETMIQDLRFGARMLAKKPGFTFVAIISLALGIAANSVIFSLISGILLDSLPFHDSGRLVAIWTSPPRHPEQKNGVSVPDYMAYKIRNRSFDWVGAAASFQRDLGAAEDGTPAERLQGQRFSASLFHTLGVMPLLGRAITPDEEQIGGSAPVVLLSYRLWQRRFAGDPKVLNRTIQLDGATNTVIGVMPPDFSFFDDQSDFLIPLGFNRQQLQGSIRFLLVAAHLRPGVSIQQAQSEMEAIAAQRAKEDPRRDAGWGILVEPITDAYLGWIRKPLLILQGAVGFVLLIACANIAGLLLTRASARRLEIAVRAALGAGRSRIIRQLLTESILLSILGGITGVFIAWGSLGFLIIHSPSWMPRLRNLGLNSHVLGFTLIVSVLVGLIFGIVPAWQISKYDLAGSLKESFGAASGFTPQRLRTILVAAQVGLAVILLVGAGLMVRTLLRLQGNGLGCDPRDVMTFQVRVPQPQANVPVGTHNGLPVVEVKPDSALVFRRADERLQALPGVRSAAGISRPPVGGFGFQTSFRIEGHPLPDPSNTAEKEAYSASYFMLTPRFFDTMKIPVLRGRDFTAADTEAAPWVAIINETMARRFFPGEEPIGKQLTVDMVEDEKPRQIIAVVGDTRLGRFDKSPSPILYTPYLQQAPHATLPFALERVQMTFLLRASGDAAGIVPSVRRIMAQTAPNVPVSNVRTVEEYLAQQVEAPRDYMYLLSIFGIVATVLAAVGVYGIMAWSVVQRSREIGIRMALGATGGSVRRLVTGQMIRIVLIGAGAGLIGALATTRLLASLLWEVTPTDPITFSLVILFLVCIAALASYIPVRRAVRADPSVALRYE